MWKVPFLTHEYQGKLNKSQSLLSRQSGSELARVVHQRLHSECLYLSKQGVDKEMEEMVDDDDDDIDAMCGNRGYLRIY